MPHLPFIRITSSIREARKTRAKTLHDTSRGHPYTTHELTFPEGQSIGRIMGVGNSIKSVVNNCEARRVECHR